MRLIPVFFLSLFLFFGCNPGSEKATQAATSGSTLRPWPDADGWWSWDGREPVLLLGASNHRAPFLAGTWRADLEYLIKTGGNYLTTTVPPPPNLRFTDEVHPALSERMRLLAEFLDYTADRKVAVEIDVWNLTGLLYEPWDSSAWNAVLSRSLLDTAGYSRSYLAGEHPLFRSVPDMVNYQPEAARQLAVQEAYLRRVLDATSGYGNVLYNVRVPENLYIPWMVHWGRFIEAYGRENGRELNVLRGVEATRRVNVAVFNQDLIEGSGRAYHPAPPYGNGMNGLALASIRGARVLEQHFRMSELQPAPELLAGGGGGARAATDGRGNYAVYLPGPAAVDLSSDYEGQPRVRVSVVGYLGTQRSELLEPPYGETFRLTTGEEKGGWLLLEPVE